MKYIDIPEYKKLLGNINPVFTGAALTIYDIKYKITTLELPVTDEGVKGYEKVEEINPDEHVMIWIPMRMGAGTNLFDDQVESDVIMPIDPIPPTTAFVLVINLPTIEELVKFVTKTYNLKAFL